MEMDETTKRRRPSGRRPGDSGTREAIAAAAARQFAELGYDRASLRGIAREAAVDPSLVLHFFGSKQGLFVAVTGPPVQPAEILPLLLSGDPAEAGLRLARFIVGLLESEDGRQRITGLVRAAASEPDAARMMRQVLEQQVLGPVADQLAVDNPRLRASFIGSQVVGLVMARYIVGVEPLASLDPEIVIATVGPIWQRLLSAPLPAG
jgi:AcrR family transcriptional regulator